LANYAPEAETVADELIKNITNADDYTSEKFVAPPLGSVLAITQLQSESGATNSTDATIDYGTKVRAERDRKQGKKRHSKKMRRYR
jgi:hypothetical protein